MPAAIAVSVTELPVVGEALVVIVPRPVLSTDHVASGRGIPVLSTTGIGGCHTNQPPVVGRCDLQ